MGALRIATFNCLNLTRPGVQVYAGVEPYTEAEYRSKTQWLSDELRRMQADIVVLQEVFHAHALAEVVQGLTLTQAAAPLADEHNTRPRVALLWRDGLTPQLEVIENLPPQCVVQVPEGELHQRYSRPLLKATFARPGQPPLIVLGLHLKSRRPQFAAGEHPDDPGVQARAQLRSLIVRAAEASAVRDEVLRTAPEALLVVAGDFNDGPDALTTRLVADPQWLQPGRAPHSLMNALEAAPAPQEPTHTHLGNHHGQGQPERIDHVLVSRALAPCVSAVQTYNAHLPVGPQSRPENFSPERLRTQSDHAAVCVTLDLP